MSFLNDVYKTNIVVNFWLKNARDIFVYEIRDDSCFKFF